MLFTLPAEGDSTTCWSMKKSKPQRRPRLASMMATRLESPPKSLEVNSIFDRRLASGPEPMTITRPRCGHLRSFRPLRAPTRAGTSRSSAYAPTYCGTVENRFSS